MEHYVLSRPSNDRPLSLKFWKTLSLGLISSKSHVCGKKLKRTWTVISKLFKNFFHHIWYVLSATPPSHRIGVFFFFFQTRQCIDVHLSSYVHDLMNLIRNSAVLLYFQPFATIKLDQMSAAFGWKIEEVEYHVVNLIQSRHIQGCVDSQNKVRVYYTFLSFLLIFFFFFWLTAHRSCKRRRQIIVLNCLRGLSRNSALTRQHQHQPPPSLDKDNGSCNNVYWGSRHICVSSSWYVLFLLFSYLTNNYLQIDYVYGTGTATTTIPVSLWFSRAKSNGRSWTAASSAAPG